MSQARPVKVTTRNGDLIGVYKSAKEAADAVGVNKGNVIKTAKGTYQQTKGYVFEWGDVVKPNPDSENWRNHIKGPNSKVWDCECGAMVSSEIDECPMCEKKKDNQKFEQNSRLIQWHVFQGTGRIHLEWYKEKGYVMTILSRNVVVFWSEFRTFEKIYEEFKTLVKNNA